jgi:hypothetical protein
MDNHQLNLLSQAFQNTLSSLIGWRPINFRYHLRKACGDNYQLGVSPIVWLWLIDNKRTKAEVNLFIDNLTFLGENYYDKEGYDRYGFDYLGFDRQGYNFYGCDNQGYYKDGYNLHGYDIFGYNQQGYDLYGFDKHGKRDAKQSL